MSHVKRQDTKMLHVISTDIKKSSSLWRKDSKAMFQALQYHHAILRTCFHECGFDICPSSPEGDAFIASKLCDRDGAVKCIENIIYLFQIARKLGKLNVGSQNESKNYLNKIHIRIGLAYGKYEGDEEYHKPHTIDSRNAVCEKKNEHQICSNKIVFQSEQAEINCGNWTNHYCDYNLNLTTLCVNTILSHITVAWNAVEQNRRVPETNKIEGMVLFIHADCESVNTYCGETHSVVKLSNKLMSDGWISIKIKRDKTSMLINLVIKSPREAIDEFDKISKMSDLVLACSYGEFNLVLNKKKHDDICSHPDAFGDTVNAAARMHNELCFLKKPSIGGLVEKNRKDLNLGEGSVYIYESVAASVERKEPPPLKF